jgi:hypothetical protein
LGFHFFIHSSAYRPILFNEIHDIVFHGKGGFGWETIYNMPIWLRKFTHKNISDFYIKEKAEYDKAVGKQTIDPNNPLKSIKDMPKVNLPEYVSKIKNTKK